MDLEEAIRKSVGKLIEKNEKAAELRQEKLAARIEELTRELGRKPNALDMAHITETAAHDADLHVWQIFSGVRSRDPSTRYMTRNMLARSINFEELAMTLGKPVSALTNEDIKEAMAGSRAKRKPRFRRRPGKH